MLATAASRESISSSANRELGDRNRRNVLVLAKANLYASTDHSVTPEVEMYREAIEPVSLYMTNKYLLILLASFVCLVVAQCAMCQQVADLSSEVRQLGRSGDDFKIVDRLIHNPRLSTQLLIKELHPVNKTIIVSEKVDPDAEHVLWSIRALRYLTGGKDFCAKASHRFGNSEEEQRRKYWIYFRHRTCASFFAMWPSRGSEYIAPEDTQKEIIDQWRDWFAKEGNSFDYKPMHDPKAEDWLW